jgi:UPF0755 protein
MQWLLLQFSNKDLQVKISKSTPLLRVLAAFIVATLTTFSLHAVRIPGAGAPDFECTSISPQTALINVSSGETGSSIAASLASAGIVKSAESFFRVAVADTRAAKIAPGSHLLNLKICARKALDQLLDSTRITGLINISEGMWLSEIIPQMYTAGFSKIDVAKSLTSASKPMGFKNIEGLLFPAQYSFAQGTTADTAIAAMIKRAITEMKAAGFFSKQSEFTAQQLLIIASLVQAEGNTKDFTKMSQVIRNRIHKGMPLQFDSTVHFIKKQRGSVFLSTESTLINSPYNTYRKYGLPPGPINNPGADALRAAVTPEPGDWLYFITVAPFDTRFTSDLSQFNNWKIEYKKNLRAGMFRSKK